MRWYIVIAFILLSVYAAGPKLFAADGVALTVKRLSYEPGVAVIHKRPPIGYAVTGQVEAAHGGRYMVNGFMLSAGDIYGQIIFTLPLEPVMAK